MSESECYINLHRHTKCTADLLRFFITPVMIFVCVVENRRYTVPVQGLKESVLLLKVYAS